ncbi:MAG: YkgJ family cysteine cluster protein [Phycisphaerales bacterium]|nr:YkgJ family cysteine cluster protein [Phycisphaerales bacterium]
MEHDSRASVELDCRQCGACCLTFDVLLNTGESAAFAARPDLVSLTVLYNGPFFPPPRFMRREADGRCAALSGGLSACHCTIYEDRPTLCREFEAGSADCLAARARLGIGTD